MLARIVACPKPKRIQCLAAKAVCFGNAWRRKSIGFHDLGAEKADRPTPENDASRICPHASPLCQPDRTHRHGCRLGKSRRFEGKAFIKLGQIAVRHPYLFGKGPGIAHADQFPRRTEMMIAGKAVGAFKAAYQRIDGDTLAAERPLANDADSFVAKNKRRDPPFIMAVPRMHVGTAYAAKGNIDNALAGRGDRRLHVPDFAGLGAGIDKCLHLAVNPPSTISTCPVT